MSNSVYIACAIILSLCAIEAAAFFKWKALFRMLNQLLLIPAPAFLCGAVAFNLGYLIGAAEQFLAIPGAHRSVILDPGGQPIPYAVIYCLIALAVLTLVFQALNQRRERK